MALNVSPRIVARINALVEAGNYPDVDSLLDDLLTPLEVEPVDPVTAALIQAGLDDEANGRVEVLDDALWERIRLEARERFARGERAAAHVRP